MVAETLPAAWTAPPAKQCARRSHRARARSAAAARAATKHIASLAGDGIGPEITAVAKAVLLQAGDAAGVRFDFTGACSLLLSCLAPECTSGLRCHPVQTRWWAELQ